jgi:hypothetical protein
MVDNDLSRVGEGAIKSTYKLGVGFERCENKGEKSAPKFIFTSTYHKEEKTTKSTKANYSSNPKPFFNHKRKVRKETLKPRDEVFVCMFCDRACHLDEFCFRRKRIMRMHFDYARNSYRDEFFDFPPRSSSRVLHRTSSRVLPQFTHGPNHRLYAFGSRENHFEPRCFGYDPRPHRGNRFLRRPDFSAGGSHTHFEPRHLNNPHFFHRGSRPTWSSDVVQRTMKISSDCMVKYCIPKIYLTNPSTESSTFSRPL